MRYGLLIDASCDVPDMLLSSPSVRVLPIHVYVGDYHWLDDRSDVVRAQFFRAAEAVEWKGRIETEPLTADEMRQFITNKLAIDFDYVFALVTTRTRSKMYDRLVDVAARSQPFIAKARQQAGVKGPFRLGIQDASTLFSGHGVTALALADEIGANAVSTRISDLFQTSFAKNAYTYYALSGLGHIYHAGKQRGERNVTFLRYAIGTALDLKPILRGWLSETVTVAKVRHFDEAVERLFKNAVAQVRNGLLAPYLVVSYGCTLTELEAMPGFAALTAACRERAINLFPVPMALGAIANTGPGGVAVGFLAPEHEFT